MFDNQVIVNDHVSVIATLVAYFVCIVVVICIALSALKRAVKARVHEEDDGNLNGLHDEEPDDGSLIDELKHRSFTGYVLSVALIVALVGSVIGAVSAVAHIMEYGITKKSIDEEIAVNNIEEKYNLTAVELVDDSAATNKNQTSLMTDSPEFIGIYNGNTVVHFVVAFQENSGEPSIAVIPPSDGITATQIERATSRNSPDTNDNSGTSDERESDVIEASSH